MGSWVRKRMDDDWGGDGENGDGDGNGFGT